MATDLSGATFSETDASNNSASPNGAPEGMAPSGVNDTMRMMMGASKRAYDRDHAGTWCTVGGTGDVITLAYTTGPAAYVQGEKFAFKATAANTGATTCNVSGLGAKNVFKKSTAGPVACVGGEINIGDLVDLEYDGTQFQIQSSTPAGVSSIADATAGGLSFSAATGAVTAKLLPSDLTAKAVPVLADSVIIADSASGSSAARSTITALRAAMSGTLLQWVATEPGALATGTTVMPYDDTIPQSSEGDQYMSLAITPKSSASTLMVHVLGIFSQSGAAVTSMALFQDATAAALAAVDFDSRNADQSFTLPLTHTMTSGTTIATTFKVRAGPSAGSTTTFNGSGGARKFGGVAASSIMIAEVSS